MGSVPCKNTELIKADDVKEEIDQTPSESQPESQSGEESLMSLPKVNLVSKIHTLQNSLSEQTNSSCNNSVNSAMGNSPISQLDSPELELEILKSKDLRINHLELQVKELRTMIESQSTQKLSELEAKLDRISEMKYGSLDDRSIDRSNNASVNADSELDGDFSPIPRQFTDSLNNLDRSTNSVNAKTWDLFRSDSQTRLKASKSASPFGDRSDGLGSSDGPIDLSLKSRLSLCEPLTQNLEYLSGSSNKSDGERNKSAKKKRMIKLPTKIIK